MATKATVTPKADQPRVQTQDLKRLDKTPNLTYRTTGNIKASNRTMRDYTRK